MTALRCAVVLHVDEETCEVWAGASTTARYAPHFPRPRVERVAPGNLVAVATSTSGVDVVVWRWYDAVVRAEEPDGTVRLWEPAHGEVIAQRRSTVHRYEPGSRAYLSAGLPGADWWVAGPGAVVPEEADVDLDEVDRLYVDNGLWPATLGG
jgi:hypothetical protein